MTLLVISPDYASHLLPLATLATEWKRRGERVVVATGPSTAHIVASFGFEHVELSLGRGSNPGVIRAKQQVAAESDSLLGFFAATRDGMVPTLTYQAEQRLTDLMWQPVEKAREVQRIVAEVAPTAIIVDHLAYSARLGLETAGTHYADIVLGHPSALPVGGEVYGFPPAWPAAFAPGAGDLAVLRELCERVSAHFTQEWNAAAAQLAPTLPPVSDAFATHGPVVLYNYPAPLADARREDSLPPHAYLGSALRDEAADAQVDAWLETAGDFVYVSFGSFLSVRDDVLRVVADGIRQAGFTAAIATGSTPPEALGELPPGWLLREYLPQVRLLGRAAAAVNHGGNNSVTESAANGVPMIVLPFSTDQFAGAAAIEQMGAGVSFDPNRVTADEIAEALATLVADGATPVLKQISAAEREKPGPARAFAALS